MNNITNVEFTYSQLLDSYIENQDEVSILRRDVTVVDSFDKPLGKFANTFGNIVVLDSTHIIGILTDFMNQLSNSLVSLAVPNLPDTLNTPVINSILNGTVLGNLADISIDHYAMTVEGVLKDREKYYMGERDVN